MKIMEAKSSKARYVLWRFLALPSQKGHEESGRRNHTRDTEPEELKNDRNKNHFVFNTSLVSRIQFDEGMEAEPSLWNVSTG